jgi:multidrug efflux system outer membrane protein
LQSALKLAELRYKGGLSNYLDVLVARRNLFEAELALTGTRRLLLASIVQLYRALGGGWSPDGQPAEDSSKDRDHGEARAHSISNP